MDGNMDIISKGKPSSPSASMTQIAPNPQRIDFHGRCRVQHAQ
jgi:hypothetical protein